MNSSNHNNSSHNSSRSGQRASVFIGVCTYRRPRELERLLEGIARQEFSSNERPAFEVLVIDNEGSPEAEAVCSTFSQRWPDIPVTCVIELKRGISQARNAILDHLPPDCDFLAMIDDDEVPVTAWLDSLLSTQVSTDADIVRGPVIARYSDSAPQWVVEAGYFGWPDNTDRYQDGQPMTSASAGNVLMRMSAVRQSGVRFNADLSLSGGEDTLFFNTLMEHGCRIVYSREAAIEEFIPPERTRLAALLRLSYRNGNNRLVKNLRMSALRGRPGRIVVFVLAQAVRGLRDLVVGSLRMLVFLPTAGKRPGRFYHGLLKAGRGAGQLTGLFGIRYQYYR